MFCEKCGHPNNNESRFCEQCGAPLSAPAQPVTQQPFAPETQQPFANPEAQPYPDTAPQTPMAYADAYQQTAPAPQPKQPLSPKAKKIILFSAIGAGVLTVLLVVLFAVIIPAVKNSNAVDIAQYYNIRFDNANADEDNPGVVDGSISGSFEWDYKQLAADKKLDENTARRLLSVAGYIVDVDREKDGDYVSSMFEDFSEGDTIKVTFTWPGREDAYDIAQLDNLAVLENECGVTFKHETTAREYKLGELLKAQGVTVKKPVEADVLGYIKDKKLIENDDKQSGDITVSVKEFETSFGEFTFKKSAGSQYVSVIDSTGNEIGSFELEFNDNYYLKDGQQVSLDYEYYDKSRMADKGIILTGDPVAYTVKSTAPTTAATTAPASTAASTTPASTAATTAPATEATSPTGQEGFDEEMSKANVDGLKATLQTKAAEGDSKASGSDKLEISNIYYVRTTDSDYLRMVFISHNITKNYYIAIQIDPESLALENGKVVYNSSYYSPSESASTAEAAAQNNSLLSSTTGRYKVTKIL